MSRQVVLCIFLVLPQFLGGDAPTRCALPCLFLKMGVGLACLGMVVVHETDHCCPIPASRVTALQGHMGSVKAQP
jgi:hypothetical protein